MESDRYSSLGRQGASDQNKIKSDGSPSTSVLKPRPKTLSPTKRPRNLRVVLENVDYRESTYTSDLFSIELALARLSGSKCRNLQRTPPATDSTGKTDDKLTVLRSLIDHHLLHCQHCRDQMEDLEYFKPEQSEQSESPDDVSRVTIDDFNLPAQEMSRLWADQDRYIDLLESKLGKMSRVSQREQMFMFKLIKKKQELKEMTTQLEKLKASRVSELGLSGEGWVCNKCYCHGIRKKDICQFPSCKASNKSPENIKRVCTSCFINVTKRSQDLTINKPLDASCGDKQPNRSLLKRKTYTILKGGGGGMVTIPIKKLRESDNRQDESLDTDPLEIIENKIPAVGDSEDNIGEEEEVVEGGGTKRAVDREEETVGRIIDGAEGGVEETEGAISSLSNLPTDNRTTPGISGKICRKFQSGRCRYGDNCIHVHNVPENRRPERQRSHDRPQLKGQNGLNIPTKASPDRLDRSCCLNHHRTVGQTVDLDNNVDLQNIQNLDDNLDEQSTQNLDDNSDQPNTQPRISVRF